MQTNDAMDWNKWGSLVERSAQKDLMACIALEKKKHNKSLYIFHV